MNCVDCPVKNGSCLGIEAPLLCDRQRTDKSMRNHLLRYSGLIENDSFVPGTDQPAPDATDRLVIVARYNEDVHWVNDCPYPAIVYNKGEPIDYLDKRIGLVHLRNRGREAGTYLHHIATAYRTLPEWLYVVQGTPHNHSVQDFFERIRQAYSDTTSLSREYAPDFPQQHVKDLDVVEWHGQHEVRYGLVNPVDPQYCNAARLPVQAMWNYYFYGKPPKPFSFGYGAQYATPRHRITDRPQQFWQQCYDEVLATSTKAPGDMASAWMFEMLWPYLLGDAKQYRVNQRVTSQRASARFMQGITVTGGCGSCGGKR